MTERHSAAVLLTGGTEINALAIAEALWRAGISYYVVSLLPRSLLRGAPGALDCVELSDLVGAPDRMRDRLLASLAEWRQRQTCPLVIFATEDGGLRCLNEFAIDVLAFAEFPRARALRYGGLDKAELFEYLAGTEASVHLPPTLVLDDDRGIEEAYARLGPSFVLKPALKPWDMDLGRMGAKVLTFRPDRETLASFAKRARRAWPLSRRWVAQSLLQPYPDGERGAWCVIGDLRVDAVQFVERWKHPVEGGTGCWVETVADQDLIPAASSILSAIDYVGLAEVPFLRDERGQPKMLEVNARAWLQVGLAERSGLSAVEGSYRTLLGRSPLSPPSLHLCSWLNVERAIAAVAAGAVAPRARAAYRLGALLMRRPDLAVYSSPFPKMRRRWLARMLRKSVGAIWRGH